MAKKRQHKLPNGTIEDGSLIEGANLITIGEIGAVYGVKGWVKVNSFTEPKDNILAYASWQLEKNGKSQVVIIDDARRHGNGIIVHIEGVDDRDEARAYCKSQIRINAHDMPDLDEEDYYWHQLEGLDVYLLSEPGKLIGKVDYLIETGANDVLVVKSIINDISDAEVLIPYLPDSVVKKVDLDKGVILVDWDLD